MRKILKAGVIFLIAASLLYYFCNKDDNESRCDNLLTELMTAESNFEDERDTLSCSIYKELIEEYLECNISDSLRNFYQLIYNEFNCTEYHIKILDKWKLVKGYHYLGGYYIPDEEDQRIVEYTINGIRILYDYQSIEITRCNYSITQDKITIYRTDYNWSEDHMYWFVSDTLKVRYYSGVEYRDEYYIPIE